MKSYQCVYTVNITINEKSRNISSVLLSEAIFGTTYFENKIETIENSVVELYGVSHESVEIFFNFVENQDRFVNPCKFINFCEQIKSQHLHELLIIFDYFNSSLFDFIIDILNNKQYEDLSDIVPISIYENITSRLNKIKLEKILNNDNLYSINRHGVLYDMDTCRGIELIEFPGLVDDILTDLGKYFNTGILNHYSSELYPKSACIAGGYLLYFLCDYLWNGLDHDLWESGDIDIYHIDLDDYINDSLIGDWEIKEFESNTLIKEFNKNNLKTLQTINLTHFKKRCTFNKLPLPFENLIRCFDLPMCSIYFKDEKLYITGLALKNIINRKCDLVENNIYYLTGYLPSIENFKELYCKRLLKYINRGFELFYNGIKIDENNVEGIVLDIHERKFGE